MSQQERPMRALLITAVALLMSGGPCTGQPAAGDATLTVRGQGRVQVAPDHANLTAEVVTRGKSPDAAAAAHRERASRAASALRDMTTDGVEIERSLFRLDEVRVPTAPAAMPGRAELEYRAVTTFELKLKRLNAVDRAITAIATTGLFEVRHLRFGIDDRNPGMNAARGNAVNDARERAETYARAAGVLLGDIIRIEDTELRGPRDVAAEAPLMRGVQVIPPDTLTLSASVTMTWRIGAKR
jgi:uncharacterized protein YggE